MFSFLFPVAGCAPVVKESGLRVIVARMDPDGVVATDGARLPLRSWLPRREPDAVVLALHGMNDYSHAFEEPGKFLSARGIAVYALDQRGFGEAPSVGYWAGEATMAEDVGTAARLLAARHPGKPLYILGESMGGAVAMVAMSRPDAPQVAGVILSAPAIWGRDGMNIFQRGALWLTSYTVPWLTLGGQGLHLKPSDNVEMLRALGRDPLVIKETRVDAVHGLCDLMDHAEEAAPRFHVPALVLYGERDEIIPAEATYRMMKRLPNNPVPQVKAIYAQGYHMLMRDLQAEVVLGDIAAWIGHPDQPLPSGADRRAAEVLAKAEG
jgi:alpha-beta hydrolase superfamily lysophospholipase